MGGDSLTQVPFNPVAKKFKIVGLFTHREDCWVMGHELIKPSPPSEPWRRSPGVGVCVCVRAPVHELHKFPKKQTFWSEIFSKHEAAAGLEPQGLVNRALCVLHSHRAAIMKDKAAPLWP